MKNTVRPVSPRCVGYLLYAMGYKEKTAVYSAGPTRVVRIDTTTAAAYVLPTADGARDETDTPVALGFAYTVALHAPDHAGQPRTWQERRLVMRSLAMAAHQEQSLRQRVARWHGDQRPG